VLGTRRVGDYLLGVRSPRPSSWLCLKGVSADEVSVDHAVRDRVSEILLAIERRGIDAVRQFSRELDGWDPVDFRVTDAQIAAAQDSVPEAFKVAFRRSSATVASFARHQRSLLVDTEFSPFPGLVVGHRQIPVATVGSYMPGGRFPIVSSPLMSVIVPKVAGVDRVIVCTPPLAGGGGPTPSMVWVAADAGADAIFTLGGVPALASMTFGFDGMGPVDMLCGAGNAFVAEAKRQLFGRVGIDLLAGPSEVAVLCDDSADPVLVAADLLGQAEHGPNSPATVIARSEAFARAVMHEIERQTPLLDNAEVAAAAWRDYGQVLVAGSREEAADMADWVACEHLEIQTVEDDWFLGRLRNYGSLFLGSDSTVTYSDKGCTGTNHTLPTQAAARYTGGLSVAKFLKTLTWQRVTDPVATRHVAEDAAAFGPVDGLQAHAYTAQLRLDRMSAEDMHAEDMRAEDMHAKGSRAERPHAETTPA
jgi:sulfopropanediol 3-dehydrogenase